MPSTAHIGPSISIKGEVVAEEDLIVSGHIDGTLRVDGHLVSLNAGSEVTANVAARTIVVAGTVLGTIVAEERIELREGATVDGELTTPKLAMRDGAELHGRVQMPGRSPDLALAS
jgi:cytoskeletal protein CcmA (bactofilin family)